LCHEKSNVLIKRIQDDLADAIVTPRAVHKKQLSQIPELRYRDIGTSCRLQTFYTGNTYAYVGSLNHGDIISAVANS